MNEQLAWDLAEKVGNYSLEFDSGDMRTPDCLPWTLTFTHDGEERHFAGQDLDGLFTWALRFIAGEVDVNGSELAPS